MKIVIAPDSFKESMTAIEAATVIEEGIRHVDDTCDIIKVPLADGGEGTIDAVLYARDGKRVHHIVTGPLGTKVSSYYAIVEDTAIIEIATVVGLGLLTENERNPMNTTTYGIGELILHALDKGIRRFIIGLGGSATNDGGIGMIQALGGKMLHKSARAINYGARGLLELDNINIHELDVRLADCTFQIACDVNNPLVGPHGATHVFGPQKGMKKEEIQYVEEAMKRYGLLIKKSVDKDVLNLPGAGAAGGLGGAFVAFLNSELVNGIEVIIQMLDLDFQVVDADLVITAEGKIDAQTMYGKTLIGVAGIAKRHDVPTVALTGIAAPTNELYTTGIDAIFSIMNQPMSLHKALREGPKLLSQLSENVFRLYQASKKTL